MHYFTGIGVGVGDILRVYYCIDAGDWHGVLFRIF